MSTFFRRELDVQEEISNILKNFINKKFHDVVIKRIEKEYDRGLKPRKADIAILKDDGLPLIIIETKKEKHGTKDKKSRFMVSSNEVLGQVFAYAAILKKNGIYVPFAATANDSQIMVFGVPEDIDKHVNWEAIEKREYGKVLTEEYIYNVLRANYLFLHKQIRFTEDFIAHVIDTITGIYTKKYKVEEKRQELYWILIEDLRGFVDFLTPFVLGAISNRKDIEKLIDEYAKSKGYKPTSEQLAREMAYVLMNKIVFYKVLEQHYGLKRLEPLYSKGYVKTVSEYLKRLNELFEDAVKITEDFEAIFKTGIYDNIDIIENEEVLKAFDWIIGLIDHYSIEKFGDLVGYVYEDLIPDEERHTLGQFYTPKPIAELIVKWAVKDPDDKVLDPGCGSGTFLIEAYKRLTELKLKKPFKDIRYVPKDVHKQVLDQLVGIDINEFPAHLTAMNLAMRNPKAPSTNINVIVTDYFSVAPGQKTLVPYRAKTVEGEKPVEIVFKDFDVVVGNPPYTRWTEIPGNVIDNIMKNLRRVIENYDLLGGFGGSVRAAQNPGIYTFWIMHSTNFLKQGGRLGMIISDSWLQTEYGIEFGKYLLDNYKIKAIIDFSRRLFKIPLIATLVLLLEKEQDENARRGNNVVFIYVYREDVSVDKLLDIINNSEKAVNKAISGLYIKVLKQKDLPRDRKWFEIFFGLDYIIKLIYSSEVIVKTEQVFEVGRGNFHWTFIRLAGTGANEFFYLTDSDVKQWYIPSEYLLPLLVSPRYSKYFVFTRNDWNIIRKEKWVFMCREPKHVLNTKPSTNAVLKYIRWGETECRTRDGVICSQAYACLQRKASKKFVDWYDLGGVLDSSIFVPYYSRYLHRFTLVEPEFKVALDADFITFVPKEGIQFDVMELKALLAYLNSSFIQLYIESRGRVPGGVGPSALEVEHARDMPILDVKKLPRKDVERLAKLFDKLEAEARRLGGADSVENVFGSELAKELTGKEVKSGIEGLFNTVIKEIDYEIAKILGLEDSVEVIRSLVIDMMRRRLARASEAKHTAIKGSEEVTELEKPKKGKKSKGITRGLDEWM